MASKDFMQFNPWALSSQPQTLEDALLAAQASTPKAPPAQKLLPKKPAVGRIASLIKESYPAIDQTDLPQSMATLNLADPSMTTPEGIMAAQPGSEQAPQIEEIGKLGNTSTSGSKSQLGSTTPAIVDPNKERAASLAAMGMYPKVVGEDQKGEPILDFETLSTDMYNPYQQQKQGVKEYKDFLQMQANEQAKRPMMAGMNLSGIASLADLFSKDKRNLAAYTQSGLAPPSAEDERNTQIAIRQKLQDELDKLQKTAIDQRRVQKPGTLTDILALTQTDQISKSIQDAINKAQSKKDEMDWLAAQRYHSRNVESIKKDPILQKQILALNSTNNAFDLLAASPNPQHIHDAMQAVRNITTGLTGAARSGVVEREETYFKGIQLDWNKLKQYYGNKVENIPADNEQLQRIRKDLLLLHDRLGKEFIADATAKAGGYSYIYEDPRFSEKLKPSLDKFMEGYTGLVDKKSESQKQTGRATTPAPQKVETKEINGVQYKKVPGGWLPVKKGD